MTGTRLIAYHARALLAMGVVAALGSGCGSGSSRTHGAAHARATAPVEPSLYGGPAPLLVYFKRAVGEDPLASQLIVDTDGRASALITLGGANGEKKHVFAMGLQQRRVPASMRPLIHELDAITDAHTGY